MLWEAKVTLKDRTETTIHGRSLRGVIKRVEELPDRDHYKVHKIKTDEIRQGRCAGYVE